MGLLRLILAISVVLAHSSAIFGCTIVGGQISVQTFFIISGFYMSLILNEKYIHQHNAYSLFISNRLLRLYPIYWFVLLLILTKSLLVYIFSGFTQFSHFDIYVNYYEKLDVFTLIYLAFCNLFIIGQDIAVFLMLNPQTGGLLITDNYLAGNPPLFYFMFINQSWTLGLEIMFYVIAPFLVRKNVKIILGIIMLLIILKIALVSQGFDYDPWTYRFFPTELVFFLLGNISYRIYQIIKDKIYDKNLLLTITSLIVMLTLFYDKLNLPYQAIIYFAIFLVTLPFIFVYTKKNRFDTIIGELSYPIYISHLFIRGFTEKLPFTTMIGSGLVLTIASILFSMLLNKIIAEPIEKIRQRRVKI
jgi:peptidoglycan/LPS O-acetylase OafA/YrhL